MIGRTHFPIFMREVSLLSFVLDQGQKPADAQTLPSKLMAGPAQLLSMQGLDRDRMSQALEHCHAGRFSRTDNRKALGSLNNLVRCYATMVEEQGGLQTCDLTGITHQINHMPQRPLNWGYAWEGSQALLQMQRSERH